MNLSRDEDGTCWVIGLGHVSTAGGEGEPWDIDTVPDLADQTVDALLALGPTRPGATLLMYGLFAGRPVAPAVLARLSDAGWVPLCTADPADMQRFEALTGGRSEQRARRESNPRPAD